MKKQLQEYACQLLFTFYSGLISFSSFISFSSPFSFFPFLKLEFQLPVLRFQDTVLLVFLPGFF